MASNNVGDQNAVAGLSFYGRLRKWVARFVIAGLLASNIATLVNAKVHDFFYAGIERVSQKLGADMPFPNSPTNVGKKKRDHLSTKAKELSSRADST